MDYKLTYYQYQQGLEKGKFLGLKCNGCDAVTFPPRALCRECNGSDMNITGIEGHGTLRTFTVIRVAPAPMPSCCAWCAKRRLISRSSMASPR